MTIYSLRFFVRSIVGASLLALAIPAQANKNSSEVTTKAATAADGGKAAGKDQRLICKQLAITGTRIKSFRPCHTKADWKKLENGDY